MSSAPGQDYLQPPEPDPEASPATDQTGEPVGFDLSSTSVYEQPSMVRVHRPKSYVPPPLSTNQATAGLLLSLIGLATAPFLLFLGLWIPAVGAAISAGALQAASKGEAAGRRRASAGIGVGILGVVLTIVLMTVRR